ncbi:hypothetical protein VTK26DRAFT_4629 [Humicola hyalothermophila]
MAVLSQTGWPCQSEIISLTTGCRASQSWCLSQRIWTTCGSRDGTSFLTLRQTRGRRNGVESKVHDSRCPSCGQCERGGISCAAMIQCTAEAQSATIRIEGNYMKVCTSLYPLSWLPTNQPGQRVNCMWDNSGRARIGSNDQPSARTQTRRDTINCEAPSRSGLSGPRCLESAGDETSTHIPYLSLAA